MKINVSETPDQVLVQLAEYIIEVAKQSISERGRFSMVLSGGSSPKKLYELLASPAFKSRIDWPRVYFFFGDERHVPPSNEQNNSLMAKKAMLGPLDIAWSHIFTMDTALEPAQTALQYIQDIGHFFAGEEWRFDLILLGLGDNSHTASLFPDTPVLKDHIPYVREVFLLDQQVYRITLNAPLINRAHHKAFLVYGKDKAAAVYSVIEGTYDFLNHPAQLIQAGDGDLQWFLDHSAAEKLSVG